MPAGRRMLMRSVAGVIAGLGIAAALAATAPSPDTFVQKEGLNLNSFVRRGPVAAHIVLRSGADPRIIVAFPAGNSGVGLWFDTLGHPAEWAMAAPAEPVTLPDAKGRPLHGVRFTISIDAARLVPRQAVLSSIRVLRDYQALGTAPAQVLTPMKAATGGLAWARDRLDGAPGYSLAVKPVGGTIRDSGIDADRNGRITLLVTALSGEAPLTPVADAELLNGTANADPAARRALDFLSYREKFLAGSWRFDTYFGRDTLMSVRLLMPALQPAAVETGLRSVLERLSPTGQAAHEEDIGEFAILDHRKADGTLSDAPVYNYNMVDSDFLLAPVARAWLLDDPRGRARAAGFLAERDPQAQGALGAAMLRNIRFLAARADAFARDPKAANLIGLRPGMDAGQWRDSNDGLGAGRYPYDVNAVLVPAALEAASALYRSGLLAPYATARDRALLDGMAATAATWREKSPALFAVTISSQQARGDIARYAAKLGVPDGAALQAAGDAPVRFHAIALDAEGAPVKVVNSDEGFALLFGHPTTEQLGMAADALGRAYPAGLATGVGLLVANPVFAPAATQARFSPNAYHGVVVWSWQQALAAAGLDRQLGRTDIPADIRARLRVVQDCLWRGIDATKSVQSSELWSWTYRDGGYRVSPFGANGGDADESNAAQLWSTVYLALHKPKADPAARCPT